MLKALFDFSFSKFITVTLIRIWYGLLMLVSILLALSMGLIVMGEAEGVAKLFGLLLIPILFFVFVVLFRIGLEVVIVIFRIAESTATTASNTGALSRNPTERVTA